MDINHIIVSVHCRIHQNCSVFRSAKFFENDHWLVVATLKFHVKSRKLQRCDRTVFHLKKLKDLTCTQEYAVANRFRVLDTLKDPAPKCRVTYVGC